MCGRVGSLLYGSLIFNEWGSSPSHRDSPRLGQTWAGPWGWAARAGTLLLYLGARSEVRGEYHWAELFLSTFTHCWRRSAAPAALIPECDGDIDNDWVSIRHICRCGTPGSEAGRAPCSPSHSHVLRDVCWRPSHLWLCVQSTLYSHHMLFCLFCCLFCTLIYSGCLPMVSSILFLIKGIKSIS